MTLQFYNTLTRAKEPFNPEDPSHVRMYVCGPTVYDYAHIGNARAIVVFDMVYRLLKRRYGHVTYARNITDVDDKINAAAAESGVDISEITQKTTAAFHADMEALGVLAPDIEPRATDHIPEMIELIETLIARGHAYEADGHVLFHVPSMPGYGALSGRNRDEQIAGARVDVAPYKKDAADFVMWKPSTPELPGWDSPWGRGRPGWHIECSAMSRKHLGQPFDIHGGGADLIFPHHENEIAQSRCAHGGPLASYWLHNGYLTVDGEKMSKSIGNVVLVRDLLKRAPGEAIRLALLMTHYRQPLDWTKARLAEAWKKLHRWYRLMPSAWGDEPSHPAEDGLAGFDAALDEDLNTPGAIAAMDRLADEIEAPASGGPALEREAALRAAGKVLGVLQNTKADWFSWLPPETALTVEQIERDKAERAAARKEKNFEASDRIRDRLAAQGIVLEDGPEGTTWHYEP